MTAVAILLALSFTCTCIVAWLAWRSPLDVGQRRSVVPVYPPRGSIVDIRS